MRKNTEKQKKLYDFQKINRTFFIDNEYKAYAHLDNALPIKMGKPYLNPPLFIA